MDKTLESNIQAVRARIEAAAREAGRDPGEITLCAATKVQTSDTIRAAIAAGIAVCGENRVQEFTAHLADDAYAGAKVHFIGHLQRNKVKYIVGKVDLIESVDNQELLEMIDKRAEKVGVVQDILIEVNMAAEESKFGVKPEDTEALLREIAKMQHIRVRGLMTVAPFVENQEENREVFRQMRELLVDMNGKKIDNIKMDTLSMGMTGDYEVAIEEGATIVRVGTGIFGERYYPNKG